ncbi:MAG: pyridoxamine 5'-phosphate oxidase family protein [Candidatus Aminicenantes bacterium]|nr:pyridoxamine 5'-phosphate oxidase family protein [Candidatus Aminicenantes bacterium]
MRRSERKITDPEVIEYVLNKGDICRLGLVNEGLAYIVPMNFGYKGGYIYFHSASEGTKIDILKQNPKVSFEIDIDHRIVEGDSACNWSASYLSIIGNGVVEFIDDAVAKKNALNVIMGKYSERKDWEFPGEVVDKTSIFRLFIKEISCKGSK